jgi:hypothetical protein
MPADIKASSKLPDLLWIHAFPFGIIYVDIESSRDIVLL